MSVVTSTGTELSDEMFDAMAEEWENDTWQGRLEKAPVGRPRLSDEDLRSVTFRLPVSKIGILDRKASTQGETRSKVLREAVELYLAGT